VELEPIAVCQTPARTVPEWIPEAARVAFGHDEPVLRETPDEARDSFTTSVPAAPSSAIAIAAAPGCVNLNTAAVDVLVTLPGVGPSRAQQIVELRSRQPFAKLRHVRRIRGIGPATYRKMKERLCPLS
jgi:competence protein ComEA